MRTARTHARRLVGEKIVDRCHGRPALCPSSSPADDVRRAALWARKSSTGVMSLFLARKRCRRSRLVGEKIVDGWRKPA